MPKKIPDSPEGLRQALIDEINGLRTGTSSIKQARTVAQLAACYLESIRVSVEYERAWVPRRTPLTKLSQS